MGGLEANWLAAEAEASEIALASWSPGLKASFDSLFDESHASEAEEVPNVINDQSSD